MDPTPAPTPSAAPDPNVGASLIDSIRTQRASAGYLLLGLAVVLLAVTIWLAVRGTSGGVPSPDKDKDKAAEKSRLNRPPTPDATSNPVRGDYIVGAMAAILVCLSSAAV